MLLSFFQREHWLNILDYHILRDSHIFLKTDTKATALGNSFFPLGERKVGGSLKAPLKSSPLCKGYDIHFINLTK